MSESFIAAQIARWKTAEAEIARITAQRDRLRDYIIEIEPDAFAHRSGFERGSPDDFDPQDYRRRHGLQSSDMTD